MSDCLGIQPEVKQGQMEKLDFNGLWKLEESFNLDEYLKEQGEYYDTV